MAKLDKIDWQLLYQLDCDCRQPINKIARTLHLAPETTRYRFERLKQEGIIKNFLAVVDGGKLGFYYYKVFLKLHNLNEQKLEAVIADLAADPRICWVIWVDGSYDVAFTPRVTNPAEQSELMDGLRSKYASIIRSWTLSVNIHMEFYSRDFWLGKAARRKAKGAYSAVKDRIALDRLSEAILREVTKNPRATASEIAERVRSTYETASSKLKQLEKDGVIVRYMLVPNIEALGHLNYYVLIYFNKVTIEREAEFVRHCAAEPNIVYLIKSLGEWDIELSIEVTSVGEYRNLMLRLTSKFSDIIDEYNGMAVHRIHKYLYP